MTSRTGSYEQLAAEYYDSVRHPTCANFRQASRKLLERLTPDQPPDHTCEVGTGASLLAELLNHRGHDLHGLILTDAYEAMLKYSRPWERLGAKLAIARADRLPTPDRSLLLVVASLADPYDDDGFWSEISRVLAPEGACVVTTPSWIWAQRFRANGQPRDLARFELRDGTTVDVPSFIRSSSEESRLVGRHGLRITSEEAITMDAISEPVSEKLLVLDRSDPLVVGYLVTR